VSSIATRPFVYDHTFPNLLNHYESAIGRSDLEPEHWVLRFGVFKFLCWLELALAIFGTLIWAYGDVWVLKLINTKCAFMGIG